jgi:Spy/CpxP family protein refolding chaperone
MSYKQKIVSVVATGFAVVSFSALGAMAQTGTTAQPQDNNNTQRQERREHRRGGFGKHDGEGRGGKHRGGKMGMRELRELNLTDAQKQQIRDLMQANHNQNPQDMQEFRQLVQAKRDGTITPEQTERLKTFKQQMRQNSDQTHQQILAILTSEQRAQLEQLKEQRREQMKQRREMRQNGQQSNTPNNDN